MKECPVSIIKEMRVKSTKYYHTSIRIAKNKDKNNTNREKI